MVDFPLSQPLPAPAGAGARLRAFLSDLGTAFVAARRARARYGAF